MKKIFILIILSFTIQFSFGQACGKYRLKYIGKISADSIEVKSVKLPTTMYLEGFGKLNSEMSFIGTSPNENVRLFIKVCLLNFGSQDQIKI